MYPKMIDCEDLTHSYYETDDSIRQMLSSDLALAFSSSLMSSINRN